MCGNNWSDSGKNKIAPVGEIHLMAIEHVSSTGGRGWGIAKDFLVIRVSLSLPENLRDRAILSE